jgi:N-acetylneuraminic acid mutarotase
LIARNSIIQRAGSTQTPLTASLPRWQEKAHLGIARTGLALAAYENQIYAISGQASDGVIGDVESYDLDTDTWEVIGSKPTPVRDVSAVVIGGRIFVPGGLQADGLPSARLEIFNPSKNQWETGSPLPVGISAYAAAAFEGKLYLFGGWDGEKYLDSVFRYDPDLDTWESLTPMPTARGFAGAAESGGRIYVIGGKDGEGPLPVNEEYTPESDGSGTNPWDQASPLPDGRYGMGLASIAGIIHLIGGVGESAEATPYRYYPQGGQWEEFEAIGAGAWSGLGLAAVEDDLHAVGGTESGEVSSAHRVYIAIYTTNIPIVQ